MRGRHGRRPSWGGRGGSQCHGWAPGAAIPPRRCGWRRGQCLRYWQTGLCVYLRAECQMSGSCFKSLRLKYGEELSYGFLNTPCSTNYSFQTVSTLLHCKRKKKNACHCAENSSHAALLRILNSSHRTSLVYMDWL